MINKLILEPKKIFLSEARREQSLRRILNKKLQEKVIMKTKAFRIPYIRKLQRSVWK